MSGMGLEKNFIKLSYGDIAYLEAGSDARPPVLFVHGIPTSSYLWRHVIRFLQNDFHCFAPDLMGLGDTDVDPDRISFHMDAQAEMLLEFMEKLGHREFNVVCHDQGGAAVQIIAAKRPEVITNLVMTDCVCYDNWPVPKIAQLQSLARIPFLVDTLGRTGFFDWQEAKTPFSAFRRGVSSPDRFDEEAIHEYLRPIRSNAKARKRFVRFLMAGSPRYTMQAVEGLKRFSRPTMVIWAADDFYISPSWGRKLYEDIPGALRFELIPFCGHFWQEDRPSEFSSLIGAFLAEHSARPRTAENKQPRKKPARAKRTKSEKRRTSRTKAAVR